MIDSLESRRLLADFASLNAGGTLSVVGTGNNDVITINQNGDDIAVRRGSAVIAFGGSVVKRFWVNAFAGNDSVFINVARPSTIIGSSGNDTLTGGNNKDSIDGNFGNDVLNGRGGDDILNGADGNDTFFPGSGTNTGDAGTGKLTIDLTGTTPGEISGGIRETNDNSVGEFVVDAPDSQSRILYDVTGGNTSVFLLATAGNDDVEVTVEPTLAENIDIPITVSGGDGNDLVFGGRRGDFSGAIAMVALGGKGNDTLPSYQEELGTTLTDGGDGDDFFYSPRR